MSRYFADLEFGSIKIGILHSLSGTMTASERPLQELLVMLIEQQNANGGLLGRPLEPVIVNPHSDPKAYAELARKLIHDDKVAAIFGCWSSASRKEVLPIVERDNALLFYPSQYEGEEASRNIFYTGATPPQQAIPAVNFLLRPGHPPLLPGRHRLHLSAHHQCRAQGLSGEPGHHRNCAERYTALGQSDWRAVVEDIRRFASGGRTAVVATVTGDANVHFFRELANQDITAAEIPVMSLSINEAELAALKRSNVARTFRGVELSACLRYAGKPRLHRRVAALHREAGCGDERSRWRRPGSAFKLWAAAVEAAGTTEVDQVRDALGGRRLTAPCGFTVQMDAKTHHFFKPVMIGRITEDGRILPVSVTEGLVPPEPWSPWLTARGCARRGQRKMWRRRRAKHSSPDTFRKFDRDQ